MARINKEIFRNRHGQLMPTRQVYELVERQQDEDILKASPDNMLLENGVPGQPANHDAQRMENLAKAWARMTLKIAEERGLFEVVE